MLAFSIFVSDGRSSVLLGVPTLDGVGGVSTLGGGKRYLPWMGGARRYLPWTGGGVPTLD